ncbi:SPOR domain-containing protein [Pedobacter sp. SD-b]|uniref:SPOR domain-containing protein n=1 Tax=Pedobacter segetis TaxID=2793069 RepID=A0ABS1BEX5_9SPHI|nr:SPOR domain-containing protein [Pedobacter segetis]MBK0381351.1 SPOR domain-containing protein [Pedobacter segetis]
MKFKNNILIIAFTLASFFASAQNEAKVTVVKNPLIDSLIARRIALTKGVLKDGTTIPVYGYRVQIYYGPDRKQAYNEQARFKSYYPEYETYLSYMQPNYSIKVGDFRNKADAQKLSNDLRPAFPTVFVFNLPINPLKADE